MRLKFDTKKGYIVHYLIGFIFNLALGLIGFLITKRVIAIVAMINLFVLFCLSDYIQYRFIEGKENALSNLVNNTKELFFKNKRYIQWYIIFNLLITIVALLTLSIEITVVSSVILALIYFGFVVPLLREEKIKDE